MLSTIVIAGKQFLANIMFSYYDHDNNGQLNEDELFDIEHRDHLEKLSRYCSLADMLTFDDKEDEDRNISLAEFYKAFSELHNIPCGHTQNVRTFAKN